MSKTCAHEDCTANLQGAPVYRVGGEDYCSWPHPGDEPAQEQEPEPTLKEISDAGYTDPEATLARIKADREASKTGCLRCGSTEVPIVDGYCSDVCAHPELDEIEDDDADDAQADVDGVAGARITDTDAGSEED